MHRLICQALQEAGAYNEDRSDEADSEDLVRLYEERVQRVRERTSKWQGSSDTIYGEGPRRSVDNGDNHTTARSHSQTRKRGYPLQRVIITVRHKLARTSALELTLIVVGVVLSVQAVATHYAWEVALWLASLHQPPKRATRALLVILACLAGLKCAFT